MHYRRTFEYHQPLTGRRRRRGQLVLFLAAGITLAAVLRLHQVTESSPPPDISALTPQPVPAERIGLRLSPYQRDILAQNRRLPFEPKVPSQGGQADAPSDAGSKGPRLERLEIRSGDTLSRVFSRLGIEPRDLVELTALPEVARHMKKLKVGSKIRFAKLGTTLTQFEYEIDSFNTLSITREEAGLRAKLTTIEPDVRPAAASGRISRSLFVDLQRAGVPDASILAFAELFGWDVDFVRDIRKGDRFKIVFEEVFRQGEKIGTGRILAAEFANAEKTLRAFFFKAADGTEGYYSQTGDAMKKAFLIAPLNFTKVSSRFNLARMHPVLNRIRAHKGVDYAAPMGTAVRAVANGRVDYAGKQSGYGNVIVLQHGERYSTLYGHLMKFASGISRGDTVKQGQLIGYVGMTGLATGPHLHYEFRINGAHVDPLKIKLPKAIPLEKKYLTAFRQTVGPLLNQLSLLSAEPEDNQRSVVTEETKRP